MRQLFPAFLVILFLSCGQRKEANGTSNIESFTTIVPLQEEEVEAVDSGKFIHTSRRYIVEGNEILVQNSLPKGGLTYQDPAGQQYRYLIFWTRVSNQGDSPVELTVSFPADSFKVLSSVNNYFRLYLPGLSMTVEKEPLFDYGIENIEQILDAGMKNPSSLEQVIASKESHTFYVIATFNDSVDGVVRAGLLIRDQRLYYQVNGDEVWCGNISVK